MYESGGSRVRFPVSWVGSADMEHEVYVPVPAERLREALAEPARVARAVPGLQQDAGGAPLSGRLKVRFGGTSVTYRGTARVVGRADGGYIVEGDGAETRGTGKAVFALTLRLRATDAGTTVVFDGTATADGRVADLPATTVVTAATRLLNRFAENLAAVAVEPRDEPGVPEPAADPEVGEGSDAPEAAADIANAADDAEAADADADAEEAATDAVASGAPDDDLSDLPEVHTSIFDTAVPPPSLQDDADEPVRGGDTDSPDDADSEDDEDAVDDDPGEIGVPATAPRGGPGEPVAEAAHARRTMIGRSAEEVDHAPPRGRYAPVPAPQSGSANATLRWAAPAAALAVASAIVVGRALRRRQ